MIDSPTNINQTHISRQPSQQNLKPGQRVYLYGDTRYMGTLIHALEKTYPVRWTVELDRGGYDSATIEHITIIEPAEVLDSEPLVEVEDNIISQLEKEILILRKTIKHKEEENQIIRQQNRELEQENHRLTEELTEAKNIIRRARDISPVMRLSLKRVKRLAHHACMDVQRTVGGWILRMGSAARKFRRLADIWDLISQDDWNLSDVLPDDKLIPIDQIQPPPPRKRPTPHDKQIYPMITPREVITPRNRSLAKGC